MSKLLYFITLLAVLVQGGSLFSHLDQGQQVSITVDFGLVVQLQAQNAK